MSDLDIMTDSARLTCEEMNVLYSPSRWCRRMSPDLVVDYYCNLALTGFVHIQLLRPSQGRRQNGWG